MRSYFIMSVSIPPPKNVSYVAQPPADPSACWAPESGRCCRRRLDGLAHLALLGLRGRGLAGASLELGPSGLPEARSHSSMAASARVAGRPRRRAQRAGLGPAHLVGGRRQQRLGPRDGVLRRLLLGALAVEVGVAAAAQRRPDPGRAERLERRHVGGLVGELGARRGHLLPRLVGGGARPLETCAHPPLLGDGVDRRLELRAYLLSPILAGHVHTLGTPSPGIGGAGSQRQGRHCAGDRSPVRRLPEDAAAALTAPRPRRRRGGGDGRGGDRDRPPAARRRADPAGGDAVPAGRRGDPHPGGARGGRLRTRPGRPRRAAVRVDLDGLVATVDLDAVAEKLDVEAVIGRVDLDEVAQQIDIEKILDRLDLTSTVTTRVDLKRIIDEVLATMDLPALVEEVMDEIDLPRSSAARPAAWRPTRSRACACRPCRPTRRSVVRSTGCCSAQARPHEARRHGRDVTDHAHEHEHELSTIPAPPAASRASARAS